MEKRRYIQPNIKIHLMPQLLQSFEISGEGDAGGAASKRGNFMDNDMEETNVWDYKW